jgi:hypothetical protein
VDRASRGNWIGTIRTPDGTLPVRLHLAEERTEIQVGPGPKVPVKELRIEQGFLVGEAAVALDLSEGDHRPTKIELQLRFIRGTSLAGAATAVSIGDPPAFGLPTFISLRKGRASPE